MSFLKKIMAILWKDLLSELRTKERLSTMFFFAILVIVVFNFSLNPSTKELSETGPGILWVAFIFAGLLGLNRSFTIERENGCLNGLLLCPSDRSVIYFGKLLANSLFMFIVEIIALPFFAVFFNIPIFVYLPKLLLVMFLGTVGFASVGTLFSAMSANTKMREAMLPILLLPIVVPVIVSAVESTAKILNGKALGEISDWLKLSIVFIILFVTASSLVFEYVIEE